MSDAKAKLKDVSDQLRTERMLVIKKDEEIQLVKEKVSNERENAVVDFLASEAFSTIYFDEFFKGFELLQQWTMKHHSKAVDYSDLNYEAIHEEIMADEDAVGAKADGKVEK